MTTDATPGYRAVLDALGATGPGLHTIHVRRVHEWLCKEKRSDLLWFGGAMVAFGHGQREAFEELTTLVDDAMGSGIATLTIVSNLPGMDAGELVVSLHHVQDGRCVTAEAYDQERYGQYPDALAAAERHRHDREAQARALYAPRTSRVTPDA
ncbi:hypothetical protein ABZY68_25680 [Streptomyces sp. NPDC006482]|uniref:hypothetical protein n=1 Tax=Streptomyces sp. NPDC006482 TaxID=3154306 RepID=UPI0033BA800D